MKTTLIRHGNSLALVIEKPILELLGVDATTLFDITTDGYALILTPVKNTRRESEFQDAVNKANKKHYEALKKLAKR